MNRPRAFALSLVLKKDRLEWINQGKHMKLNLILFLVLFSVGQVVQASDCVCHPPVHVDIGNATCDHAGMVQIVTYKGKDAW